MQAQTPEHRRGVQLTAPAGNAPTLTFATDAGGDTTRAFS
jgi:hypothetical protein